MIKHQLMFNFLFTSKRKMFLYIFLFVLIIVLVDYINHQREAAEWDREVLEYRRNQDSWQREYNENNKSQGLTPEQKQRQEDALNSGFESSEPLPSEVNTDDEEMYNWIMDHPEYDGDYEHFKDRYENEHGDYDDYEK